MVESKKVDIITMGLINSYLNTLIDEMTQVVVRTSVSPITRDAFDFQCAFCNAKGEIVVEGEGTLIHTYIYPNLIRNWLEKHRNKTYPRDIIITNDPFSGAAHLPDFYMLHPIFIGDELVAWTVAGGHQRDVGGLTPGSCACNATEVYQEGLRIPPLKLYERDIPNETLFTIIAAASRTPEVVLGDIQAYRSALYTGEERFMELVKTYGWETVNFYLEELFNYAERLTREAVKAIPDGEYEFRDYLDDEGFGYLDEHGRAICDLVPINLKITIKGDSATYDFTGTAPQVRGSMNNPFGTSWATAMIGLRFILDLDIPRNQGSFRGLKIILPEGTLLNPLLPAGTGSRGATMGRQMDVILGAEAQIAPDKVPACCSQVDTLLNIGGRDKNGKPYILIETHWGGWGGRPSADGIDFMTVPQLNGSNQPCETNEEIYPIRYMQYAYVPDTEGAGRYRGSLGVIREWEFIGDQPATMQLRVDRQRTGPYGLFGGQPGHPLEAIFNPEKENRHLGKTTMMIKKGDLIRIMAAGAGGWGNPLDRDVSMVLDDVRNEKVSAKRAREVYGVVINEHTMEVDIVKTQKLRKTIKAKRDKSHFSGVEERFKIPK